MQKLVFGLVAMIAISACSKDKKDAAAPVTPARTQDHKPSECPKDLVGAYENVENAEGKFEIVINDGILVMKDPENGDVRIDGTPAISKADGTSITIICQNDTLVVDGRMKDGSSQQFVLHKSPGGLRLETGKPGEDSYFRRVGAPTSPTETELKREEISQPIIQTPTTQAPTSQMPNTQTLPDLSQILEPGEVATPINICPNGFMVGYMFEDNGCSTGSQTFCSPEAYCAGLKDETLNKGCAKAKREARFNEQCQ